MAYSYFSHFFVNIDEVQREGHLYICILHIQHNQNTIKHVTADE